MAAVDLTRRNRLDQVRGREVLIDVGVCRAQLWRAVEPEIDRSLEAVTAEQRPRALVEQGEMAGRVAGYAQHPQIPTF
jgi:hypothetical protein